MDALFEQELGIAPKKATPAIATAATAPPSVLPTAKSTPAPSQAPKVNVTRTYQFAGQDVRWVHCSFKRLMQ